MLKKSLVLIFLLMLAFSLSVCSAQTGDTEKARESLKATFPKLTFESFSPSPISGLYEVTAGDQVFYYSPQGYLVFGSIINKDGSDLTGSLRGQLIAKKVEGKALKMGSGKNIVIEVSDPDCPFCRQASEAFEGRTDVTRYVVFMPLTQIHPHSVEHVKYILSKNSSEAYEDAYKGKLDGKDVSLSADEDKRVSALLDEHIQMAKKMGLQGTPAFWINGNFVAGANIKMIEKYLNEGGAK